MNTNRIKAYAKETKRKLQNQIEIKLNVVVSIGSIESIENPVAVKALNKRIAEVGKKRVIEETAYIWFNRFTALRFMDANGYNSPMILSPLPGQIQPEILVYAKRLEFFEMSDYSADINRITGLLTGKFESTNPELEAYRILLLCVCKNLSHKLPFIFEDVGKFTELLLPDDLLSANSLTRETVASLNEEECKSVEVVGWLYQFFISEKKSEAQKKAKNSDDEIAAVTQLFTPEWIVRYMVENSLGRLWMLNNPTSELNKNMNFYIEPHNQKDDFLKIKRLEDYKFCDPCCGSGHILVYAFDLFYLMYLEEGYSPSEAVCSIIKNNLYGIEIDDRAGQLAYFSLMMKAREKDRDFLESSVKPHILVLQNYSFDNKEKEYFKKILRSDYNNNLDKLLNQFERSKTLGSLIIPEDVNYPLLKKKLDSLNSVMLDANLIEVINQAEYLSKRYSIVVTNPPYYDPSKSDSGMGEWAKDNYPLTKTDTGVMFMERVFRMTLFNGYSSIVNLNSWMFLSSYQGFRFELISTKKIISMIHIGTRGFDSISGDIVSTTAFVISNSFKEDFISDYYQLTGAFGEEKKSSLLLKSIKDTSCPNHYYVDLRNIKQIPGTPIAYWASSQIIKILHRSDNIENYIDTFLGIITGNNDKFLRLWHELPLTDLAINFKTMEEVYMQNKRWIPYNKGGDFRKWYGIQDYVIDWENGPADKRRGKANYSNYYLREYVAWSYTVSDTIATRYYPQGFLWDVRGSGIFDKSESLFYLEGLISSKIGIAFFRINNSTASCQVENIQQLPVLYDKELSQVIKETVKSNNRLSKEDWDSFEISWDFQLHPLIPNRGIGNQEDKESFSLFASEEHTIFKKHLPMPISSLKSSWEKWKNECTCRFINLKENEEKLNRIFIDIYGLQDEMKAEEEDKEVTVRKADLGRDIRSLISYAVGCMFGRYSLDEPGLQFAGGDWDSFDKSVFRSFRVDNDNAIPVLSDEYFKDDIVERFSNFILVVYGETSYRENMNFIESAIGKPIRQYFAKDFYLDHIKIYKNRPIYWMFSSPSGGFNTLIYLHRYDKNTVGIVRNEYLMEYRNKLSQERNMLLDKTDRVSMKESDNLQSLIKELDDYDTEVMYPLANRYVELNLNDGVKVNYNKFGKALLKVKGLSEE